MVAGGYHQRHEPQLIKGPVSQGSPFFEILFWIHSGFQVIPHFNVFLTEFAFFKFFCFLVLARSMNYEGPGKTHIDMRRKERGMDYQ